MPCLQEYLTNTATAVKEAGCNPKRVQCKDNGFDKMHRYLTSVKPYTNGVELQYGNKTYNLVVPDGALAAYAIKLANQCIILTEYM